MSRFLKKYLNFYLIVSIGVSLPCYGQIDLNEIHGLIEKNNIEISTKLFNYRPDSFFDSGTIIINDETHTWAGYCGYGPPHGGAVIFSPEGNVKHVVGGLGCVTEVETRDTNNDGSIDLLIYDYSTGTGVVSKKLYILYFDDSGDYSEMEIDWSESSSSAYYNPQNEDDVIGYDFESQAKLDFKDEDNDGFKELLNINISSEYVFEEEREWINEVVPERTKNTFESFVWDEGLNRYVKNNAGSATLIPWADRVYPTIDDCSKEKQNFELYEAIWRDTRQEMNYILNADFPKDFTPVDAERLFNGELYLYEISHSPDLNQDGQCEVMVSVAGTGGSGGSPERIYAKGSDGYQLVAHTSSSIAAYYSARNGWLRYVDSTSGGWTLGHKYFNAFIDGKYKTVYVDEWVNGRFSSREVVPVSDE